MAPAANPVTDNATVIAPSDYGRVLAQRERRFAAALLAPAFAALLLTTTFPLLFLI
jgi:multiple sugar transport system permease protein